MWKQGKSTLAKMQNFDESQLTEEEVNQSDPLLDIIDNENIVENIPIYDELNLCSAFISADEGIPKTFADAMQYPDAFKWEGSYITRIKYPSRKSNVGSYRQK